MLHTTQVFSTSDMKFINKSVLSCAVKFNNRQKRVASIEHIEDE